MAIQIPICAGCGVPHIPDDIRRRVIAGEKIEVEFLYPNGLAGNTIKHGCGGLNIDASRIPTDWETDPTKRGWQGRKLSHDGGPVTFVDHNKEISQPNALGRWPSNVIIDDSQQVADAFAAFGESKSGADQGKRGTGGIWSASSGTPCGPQYGDTGTAARFFMSCPYSEEEWTAFTNASVAAKTISLQSELAVSALSNAVERSTLPLALIRASYQGRDTSVTENELRTVCASVTALILNIDSKCSPELRQKKHTLNNDPVICVARSGPTGTTTITVSLLTSDGCAELATFSITQENSELGGKVSASISRFHFCGKADAEDRAGSKHPTVKPASLMRYLVKLITPPGGTVLDPFAGSGSTLLAADQLGFNAVGIEMDPTYAEDARRKVTRDAGMFAEVETNAVQGALL